MVSFTINEPHPTVAKGHYVHSGRGGAGNYFRAPATTPSAGVPMHVTSSNTTASSTSSRRYFAGRGGAGNIHTGPAEAHLVNFEEEFARAQHRELNPIGHVGRGGAGNCYRSSSTSSEGSSSRRSSAESNDSGHRLSGFWARVSGQSLRS